MITGSVAIVAQSYMDTSDKGSSEGLQSEFV
jgi:hypothetical protein